MAGKTPLRVRMAIASDRWFKRSIAALRVAHQGFWLGTLRSDDLAAANAAAYAQWDRYRDDAYNRSGLSDWESEVVLQYLPSGSSVLVPSAGAGREILGLEALGYRAEGFDPSPVLVKSGQRLLAEAGGGARLLLSPPDALPATLGERFDAILFGWGGYIHIRGRATRIAFLRDLRGLVDQDAPMVVSFFLRSPDDRTFLATLKVASSIHKIRRARERVELGDTVAATFDHYFTWDEIESELTEAGFSVLAKSSSPYPHVVCRAA